MKIIVSPTKQMKPAEIYAFEGTTPQFKSKAEELRNHFANMDYDTLKKTLKASDSIIQNVYTMYHTPNLAYPALLTYSGIAFQYMAPDVFSDNELDYVQNHLRILSGMYGMLKPFDLIEPYRLEMQTKCPFSLYEYWKDDIANALQDDFIINLASEEYAKCIRKYKQIIDIRFVEANMKEKGVYAKMARGEMVRYMAEHNVQTLEELKKFDRQNYKFSSENSKENLLVFIRQ